MLALWIIGILIVLFLAMFVMYYNRFVVLGNRIDNSLSQIDVQLQKRGELVPNLVKTVKGYAKHEAKIMKEVTEARKVMMGAKDLPAKMKAGNQLQEALKSILAVAENYPDLKASTNFQELQRELSAIEDKIAYARQFYNDSILTYNNSVEALPGVIFAKMLGKKEKEYVKLPAATKAVPKVDF